MDARIPDRIPLIQKAISVLWPSFIIAIVATWLFFSAFYPDELTPFDTDFEISPLAIYSIGFFVFWLLTALSSLGTLYFTISNRRFLDKQGN